MSSEYQLHLFFVLSLLSGIGYAIHNALLAGFGRSTEGLSVLVCRNLSFWITLSPLLFLAGWEATKDVLHHWPSLLLAGLFGALCMWVLITSYRFLAVGISSAFLQISPLFLMLWMYLCCKESISAMSFFWVMVVLVGVSTLAAQKNHMPHLEKKVLQGLSLVFLAALFLSLSYFFMVRVAHVASPFATAYFWEFFVGVFALLFYWGRKILGKKTKHPLTPKLFLRVSFASLPVLLGSGLIPLAMSMGPSGIALAISSSVNVMVASILAFFLHQENLRIFQWMSIAVIILGIIGVRLSMETV